MDPQRDEDANLTLETFFEEYSDAIFRYVASQLRDREVAKDITQDAFIRFWQCLERGDKIEHKRALLYKIAGNLVIDYTRRKKSVSLDALLEQGFEQGEDTIRSTKGKMELERILTAIDRLPSGTRQVLLLRFIEGFDPSEIASMTKVTSNVVSVRIHRGLSKLRSLLQHA